MRRPIHLIAFIAVFSLLFTACKKESSDTVDVNETEFKAQSDDQANFTQETDEVADEINGGPSNLRLPCREKVPAHRLYAMPR